MRGLVEEIGVRVREHAERFVNGAVNETLRPIRQRRNELIQDRGYLRRVLADGSAAARTLAQETLTRVSAAMHTQY